MRVSKDIVSAWKRVKRYYHAWQRTTSDEGKEKLLLKLRKCLELLKGIFYAKGMDHGCSIMFDCCMSGYFYEACKIFKVGIDVDECVKLLEAKFARHGIIADLSALVQYTDKDTTLAPEIQSEKMSVRFATT